MKKLGLAVVAVVASMMAFASAEVTDGPKWTAFELDLASPLQVLPGPRNIDGLRLNLIWGNSLEITGADLSFVGACTEFCGYQQGLANWVESNAKGVQLGGLFNYVGAKFSGIQFAGGVNYTGDDAAGLEVGLANFNAGFYGVQFGGLFNWNRGLCMGLQVGPLFNYVGNAFNGAEIGFINYVDRLAGFQCGFVNVVTADATGLQLGAFNCAGAMTGVQIGLVNIIQQGMMPIMVIANASF